jgi:drug/metabolite transporter (DMT)-like permease
MVYAQKTIPIGTISIAQVVQPALAVVWSFLLLGETLQRWQFAGIAIALGGLLAFIVMNQRGERRRTEKQVEPPPTSDSSGAGVVV